MTSCLIHRVRKKYVSVDDSSYLCIFICGIFGPYRYFLELSPDINNCSTYFITIIELLPYHSQQLVEMGIKNQKPSYQILEVQKDYPSKKLKHTVYNQGVSDFHLGKLMVHFPPLAHIGSSHFGSILCLKQQKSAPTANLLGLCILL